MNIQQIEEALRLHINYKGVSSQGKYLAMMDSMSHNYTGAPGIRLSKLLDDYYKEVGVSNLDEALQRLRRGEDMKQNIMKLANNRRLNDKSSLAYVLNHINPQRYVYLPLTSYKRDELITFLDKELNNPANCIKVKQLRTFADC